MRSTIDTIHAIQMQTEFRPVQHYYCHLNKECNLNQSKDDSFVGRVAKNNTWNNGDRHKTHEIFPVVLFSL